MIATRQVGPPSARVNSSRSTSTTLSPAARRAAAVSGFPAAMNAAPAEGEDVGAARLAVRDEDALDLAAGRNVRPCGVERGEPRGRADEPARPERRHARSKVQTVGDRTEKRAVARRLNGQRQLTGAADVRPPGDTDRDAVAKNDDIPAIERARILDSRPRPPGPGRGRERRPRPTRPRAGAMRPPAGSPRAAPSGRRDRRPVAGRAACPTRTSRPGDPVRAAAPRPGRRQRRVQPRNPGAGRRPAAGRCGVAPDAPTAPGRMPRRVRERERSSANRTRPGRAWPPGAGGIAQTRPLHGSWAWAPALHLACQIPVALAARRVLGAGLGAPGSGPDCPDSRSGREIRRRSGIPCWWSCRVAPGQGNGGLPMTWSVPPRWAAQGSSRSRATSLSPAFSPRWGSMCHGRAGRAKRHIDSATL